MFLASLGWSAYLTSTDPLPAYFVTPTRAWELALGGLVALLFFRGAEPACRCVRLLAGWLGLAMIGYAVVAFSSDATNLLAEPDGNPYTDIFARTLASEE